MADEPGSEPARVRKGQGSVQLTKEEFRARWTERFYDPAFESAPEALERLAEIAWDSYEKYRKNPRVRRAGHEFADPEFNLPVEWLETRQRIMEAATHHAAPNGPSRVLLVCASPRTDETCPGEMSKTFRIANVAREVLSGMAAVDVDFLDLSRLTAEYGRTIYPCKACVSTAMPLCHWPCSCYPNHAMGQVNDWMHEIYPRWVAAHGVMIVTPVHWYQAPSVLKLMIDRLVCADGGNPDPTTTRGKSPEKAKALELKGWAYPKHLKNRAFAIVVHGDAAGAEGLRRALHDWLSDLALVPAGSAAIVDAYIGYYEPYATSHDALDRETDLMEEVRNAARTLAEAVTRLRAGTLPPGQGLRDPRQK